MTCALGMQKIDRFFRANEIRYKIISDTHIVAYTNKNRCYNTVSFDVNPYFYANINKTESPWCNVVLMNTKADGTCVWVDDCPQLGRYSGDKDQHWYNVDNEGLFTLAHFYVFHEDK